MMLRRNRGEVDDVGRAKKTRDDVASTKKNGVDVQRKKKKTKQLVFFFSQHQKFFFHFFNTILFFQDLKHHSFSSTLDTIPPPSTLTRHHFFYFVFFHIFSFRFPFFFCGPRRGRTTSGHRGRTPGHAAGAQPNFRASLCYLVPPSKRRPVPAITQQRSKDARANERSPPAFPARSRRPGPDAPAPTPRSPFDAGHPTEG